MLCHVSYGILSRDTDLDMDHEKAYEPVVSVATTAAVDLEVEVAHEDHLHQGQQAHKQVDGCCHIIPQG